MGTDTADWDAALRGDGDAFAELFRRHRDRVRRHAYALTESAADAEDVVAVTFMEAWRLRQRVRFVDGSLLPWLLTVAQNVARNQQRAGRRYQAAIDRLPEPEAIVLDEEPREALAAVAALPPRFRDVAVLCLVEGYSERETAEALGIRPGTVKSRLSTARARLRADLSAESLSKELRHVL